MPAKRSLGTKQSLTFIGALLVTSAFTVPAFAQIETVVVTAEKKAEDIQSVPIAVTAYTAQDLAAHQVNTFKDIQFSTPNVYYSKTNFTGTNFAIRGIGTQVISGDAESGIAFNTDNVYQAFPPVDSGQFYDLESVQILRGPQSTLYGRGATGGAVNVFSAKPQLDAFAASVDASYGTYNTTEIKGMVNMPIIDDELGIRIAGDWVRHDGYATNVTNSPFVTDHHPDSRDQWSVRGSVRWQPTQDTTVDIVYSHGDENDTRMRGEKQLCHTDPSGVLGCLPDKLDNGAVNPNATFLNIPISTQAAGEIFGFPTLGLFDLTQPFVPVPGAVPANPRELNSDFTPSMNNTGNGVTVEVKQKINSWLDATFDGGYSDGSNLSQESYTNSPGTPFNPISLLVSEATFDAIIASFGNAQYADPNNGPYAFILAGLDPGNGQAGHNFTLPTSKFTNLGIIGGSIERYSNNPFAYDQSNAGVKMWSGDLRFNTNFDGPLNFMLGFYYLRDWAQGDYFVGSNTLDYGQVLIGGIAGPGSGVPGCGVTESGCVFGTPYYDNRTDRAALESKAVYGEAYYWIMPDQLKLTIGLRGTEDTKELRGRISILNGLIPLGSKNQNDALETCFTEGQPGCDFDGGTPGRQLWEVTSRTFDKITGRAVLDYNPKWDLTDATLLYASYARGYKAGGSNPGIQAGNIGGIPSGYDPESIDAYEIGAKNTLLDGRLQANLTAWYYNYGNYQISAIIANTSVNTNINTFLDGLEGEFLWAPDDHWQFNFNANWTESKIGRTEQIDTRNPGGGLDYAVVIKDATLTQTNAQNCVIYHNGTNGTGNLAADFNNLILATGGLFFQDPAGLNGLAGAGVPNAAYGTCNAGILGLFGTTDPVTGIITLPDGFTTGDAASGGSLTGVPVQLDGNQLANTAPYSISFGAQYTAPVGGGYNLVSRVDYYWQAPSWGRIFNDPADRMKAYGVANALITLNAPDNQWYVQGFARNLFGSNNQTGQYLTSSSSGLWTGVFYGEPRTIGIQVGARF